MMMVEMLCGVCLLLMLGIILLLDTARYWFLTNIMILYFSTGCGYLRLVSSSYLVSIYHLQAMNFFAALLLLLMPEENAFWYVHKVDESIIFNSYYYFSVKTELLGSVSRLCIYHFHLFRLNIKSS